MLAVIVSCPFCVDEAEFLGVTPVQCRIWGGTLIEEVVS